MGWDIQINPTAEAFSITRQLAEVLDPFLEDFQMRYAALSPSDELIDALRIHVSKHRTDSNVVTMLLAELDRGEDVEVMLGN